MNPPLPLLRKKRVWIPLALYAAYVLFGFLILPGILRGQIIQGVRKNLGRELRLDKVRVNPVILSLTMQGFELRDPDGTSFVAFDRLYADFQVSSLVRRALTFREFRLDGPRLDTRLMPDGKVNFADMIKPAAPPPRLIIGRFQINGGSVHVANLMAEPPEEGTLAPIQLTLDHFTTIPRKEGQYHVAATDPGQGSWKFDGDLTFEPLHSAGVLEISGSRLRSWWEILKRRSGHLEVTDGQLGCRLEYQADVFGDSLVARVNNSSFTIHGLAVRERGGSRDMLTLDTLSVTGVELRVPEQTAAIHGVLVAGANVQAWLNPDTTVNWQYLLSTSSPARPAASATADSTAGGPPGAAPALPWSVALDELAIYDFGVDFEDRTRTPAFAVSVKPVNARIRNISSRPGASFALQSDATIAEKGRLELSGTVSAQPLAADLEVALKTLPLPVFQPYVDPIAKLRVASGTLGVAGVVQVREGKPVPEVTFKGTVESHAFMSRDRRDNEPFLGWKAVQVNDIDYSSSHVSIGAVKLTEPFVKLIVNKNRVTNIQEMLGLPTIDSTGTAIDSTGAQIALQTPESAEKQENKSKQDKHAKDNQVKASEALAAMRTSAETPMPVSVGRVEVVNGSADFADFSLILPFVARIEQLGGSITTMSSSSAGRATVDLEGKLQPTGTTKVGGTMNPWARDTILDLRVAFNDFHMPALTPYAGQFLGREIDKGRMTLDLGYRLQGRHLVGENKLVLDQLELGKKIDSPEATKLPVGLAIAILKDGEGKIDLDVPVEGDLDDPKFRIGKVIWQFIKSLLGKVATAPFKLLGHLFGGGGDDDELGHVGFDPGASALVADDQASVDKLAEALTKRPKLNLEVRGSTDDSLDATAIRKAKFAVLADEKLAANPKRYGTGVGYSSKLLKELLTERLGKKSVGEFEKRFTTTAGALDAGNPRYKEGSDHRVVDEVRMNTAIQDTLTALLSAGEADLVALANARAEVIRSRLVAQGIEEHRVYLLDPEPAKVEDGRIRMDLNLTD